MPTSCLLLCFYASNLHRCLPFLVTPKYFSWAAAGNLPLSSKETGWVLPAALPGLPCFIPWAVRSSLPGACIPQESVAHCMHKSCCKCRLIPHNLFWELCLTGQALGLTLFLFHSAPGRLASISGQSLSPWWWESLCYLLTCRSYLSPAHLSSWERIFFLSSSPGRSWFGSLCSLKWPELMLGCGCG